MSPPSYVKPDWLTHWNTEAMSAVNLSATFDLFSVLHNNKSDSFLGNIHKHMVVQVQRQHFQNECWFELLGDSYLLNMLQAGLFDDKQVSVFKFSSNSCTGILRICLVTNDKIITVIISLWSSRTKLLSRTLPLHIIWLDSLKV